MILKAFEHKNVVEKQYIQDRVFVIICTIYTKYVDDVEVRELSIKLFSFVSKEINKQISN